jgi:hypothetical protein
MPASTLALTILREADFEALLDPDDPSRGFLHFRNQYLDPDKTQLITYRDPMTDADTGQTARQVIAAQASAHGWPLIGLYISGSGQAPHCAVHRSSFPSNPPRKAERLQDDLNTALEVIYKSEKTIDDPTDPEFGQVIDIRNFWVNTHVFNYREDGLYEPNTDFIFQVSSEVPHSDWWK